MQTNPAAEGTGGANAAIICAVILTASSLYLLRSIVAPFLLALFLLIVIGGLSRLIRRLIPGLARPLAMAGAVAVILCLFGAIVFVLFDNISSLLDDADQYVERFRRMAASLQHSLGVSLSTGAAGRPEQIDVPRLVAFAAGGLQSAISATGFVLIYLCFMMVSRRAFSRKLLALTGARTGLEEAQSVFERIRESVGGYIWVQTATGAMIAVLSWLVLWAFGAPQPIFWAFVIFVASYVPIVGGIVGVFAPALFSLATNGNLATALLLLASLQAIQIVIGNVVQPRMQSQSLNIDPIVVLLSLALWGALLGPVGAFLSTPLTVTAMLVLAQFPRTRWMAILLSSDGRPDAAGAKRANG